MQRFLAKSIGLVILIGIVLFVGSLPVFAGSVEGTTDDYYSEPCQKKPAIPQNCLTPDCPLCHCNLANAVTNEILLLGRFTPKEDVYPNWSPTSVTPEISPSQPQPLQRDPTQEPLPPRLGTEYHCRNGLHSEEPPQV